MKLLSLLEQFGKEDSVPLPELDTRRCLHNLDRSNPCTACAEMCPTGAIVLADKPGRMPQLDREACRCCLACLSVCPTGAFTAQDPVPDLIRCAGRVGAERLELMCAHHPSSHYGPGDAAITVRGCLAGLGTAAYLALATQGVTALSVRDDACAGCPWHTLEAAMRAQVTRAQALLRFWPVSMVLNAVGGEAKETWQERPCYRAESPPFTRRSLALLVREAEKQALTGGEHPFHERLRTMHSIRALPPLTTGALAKTVSADTGFAMVYVHEKCNACGTCARACPTSALELDVSDGHFRLTFLPGACVACDLCARLCPEAAVSIDREPAVGHIFGGDLFLLYEGEIRRCARCKVLFAPQTVDVKYCEVCAFRRENPFATKMPPGLDARALGGKQSD